jgi:hypothetical protein
LLLVKDPWGDYTTLRGYGHFQATSKLRLSELGETVWKYMARPSVVWMIVEMYSLAKSEKFRLML